MKRTLIMGATAAGRGLRVLVTSAMLSAVLAVAGSGIAPAAAGTANSAGQDGTASVFYTTSGAGNGLPNGAEIFAITVSGSTVTTRDVGPTSRVVTVDPLTVMAKISAPFGRPLPAPEVV